MNGLAPKLPVYYDKIDGSFAMIKNYQDLAAQNLKNLILTVPGERVMEPRFGVGLRNYLFDQDGGSTVLLKKRILNQVNIYLPYIVIEDVAIEGLDGSKATGTDLVSNYLSLKIEYHIAPIDKNDVIDIYISS